MIRKEIFEALPTNGIIAFSKYENSGSYPIGHRPQFIEEIYAYSFKVRSKFESAMHELGLTKQDIVEYMVSQINFSNSEEFIPLKNENIEDILHPKIKEIQRRFNIMEWTIIDSGLEVHHKYYKIKSLPWEYPDNAFITLCWDCHEKTHSNTQIPVLNEKGIHIGLYNRCSRCLGAGIFPQYNHVSNGICFKCRGAKYEELIDLDI